MLQYGADRYVLLVHYQRLHTINMSLKEIMASKVVSIHSSVGNTHLLLIASHVTITPNNCNILSTNCK